MRRNPSRPPRTLLRTSIFRIGAEEFLLPGPRRRSHTFYLLHAPDWINVLPVDDAGRVWAIRQFRHGTMRRELEIPGGGMDGTRETPLAAAKRELREETGAEARRWIPLGRVHPNPAFHRNWLHMFLAVGVRRVAEQRLDPAEFIDVDRIPLRRIPGLIARGRIAHALVINAFHAALTRPAAKRALHRFL